MHPNSSRFWYKFSSSSGPPGPDYDSWRRFHFHRRPSRILWFAIGAASATVFIMHRESKRNEKAMYWHNSCRTPVYPQASNVEMSQVLAEGLPTVPSGGSDTPNTPSPYPYSHPHHHAHWSWGFAKERSFQYPPPALPPPGSAVTTSNSANVQAKSASAPPTVSTGSLSLPNNASATSQSPVQNQTIPWSSGSKFDQQNKDWEQERLRLLNNAQNAMNELSESALDSLASTVEVLKTKITEHRLRREQQQKQLEKELEEQKKNPVRYV
ncbi:hypothetical protein D9757_004799 [Collybiopsis confluens]|uniref:Uncharacterized protein n=1 Tax=Collybiopsis confluens TaxID=2823264 RepID=A0A8H5HSJ8_9AGAR|nr:hypothetical protein D9757_004799 [Collybiopsis confluens]